MAIGVIVALTAVGSATAAVRHASPSGVPSASCQQSSPCDIYSAIVDAPDYGDEVQLASGDYGSPAAPLVGVMLSTKVSKIAPAVGAPRPHLYIGGTGYLSIYNGGLIADIDIDSTSTSPSGTIFGYLPNLERVVVRSKNNTACKMLHDTRIENSVCATSAPSATGLDISSPSGYPRTVSLRNVTAWSSDPGGKGITIAASSMTPMSGTIMNTIARGGSVDLAATSDGSLGNVTTIGVFNSNFASAVALGAGASLSSVGTNGNQSAAPAFVDAAAVDLRPAIGSPTIDAGQTAPLLDGFDAINHVRIQGGGTDIGAYEFTPQSSTVTALAVTPSKFRAAKKGAMISAKKKKKAPMRGTVSVTVNQSSGVKLTLERAKPGRKSGKSCVPVKKKNVRRKKCTRYAGIPGFFWLNVPTGTKTAVLSGRSLKRKPFVPGKYRVKAIPVAVGAPAGPPAYAKFSIVR